LDIPEQVTSTIMVSSYEWRRERCEQEQAAVSCVDPVNLIRRHYPDYAGSVRDDTAFQRAGPASCDHVMDLNLPGMGVVADSAAGIDKDMMEAEPAPGILSRYQVL
jgi:hypothetical protein